MQPVQRAANDDTWIHLFVDGIMEAQLPPRWKTLTIDYYGGLSDLDEHMDVFVTQMSLFMNDVVIMCQVFHVKRRNDHRTPNLVTCHSVDG